MDCIKTYIFSKASRYVDSAGKKYQEIKDPDSSEKTYKELQREGIPKSLEKLKRFLYLIGGN